MTFRQMNERYFVPGAQSLMILGIIALCQPWNLFLHRYGLTIILIGLVGFLITAHISPKPVAVADLPDDFPDAPGLNSEPDTSPAGNRGGRS